MSLSDIKKWLEKKEKGIAKSAIKWKLERDGLPIPDEKALDEISQKAVSDANRIVNSRGKEVIKAAGKGVKEFVKEMKS